MSSILITGNSVAKLKVQIAALTALGIEAPEHATEMTHSRVKTTLKFLQCMVIIHEG